MTSIYKTTDGKKQVLSFYENILSNWHKPSNQLNISTSLGNTFILESGMENKECILLLHGSGSTSGMWMADVKELSKHYHVFAIDIIGECGKSAESRPSFKSDSYSNWLYEIIAKLSLNKVSLIACSLGGWIAMDFAIKYPTMVDKLVLLASAGLVQIKAKTLFYIIITSMLGSWGFNKLNKLVYGNLDIDKTALKFASLIKQHYKPRTDALPIISDVNLKKINATTLYIGGENDCFYDSKKAAYRLNSNMKYIKCFVLEDTGHVLLNNTSMIMQFLRS